SSVSIFPNVMSSCFSLAAWKTGANIRHGPHHDAHQSTRVIPGLVTVSSNVFSVSAIVLISLLKFSCWQHTPVGITLTGARHSRPWAVLPAEGACANRYLFGAVVMPRMPLPKTWYEAGIARQAATVAALGQQTHLPGLAVTVEQFNLMAAQGHDDHFGRG